MLRKVHRVLKYQLRREIVILHEVRNGQVTSVPDAIIDFVKYSCSKGYRTSTALDTLLMFSIKPSDTFSNNSIATLLVLVD
jgi:hypothetical protein